MMTPATAAMTTTMPMPLFTVRIRFTSKRVRTLSMAYVSANHHTSAPISMDTYPSDCCMKWSGTTKVNRANKATKRNMMSGLEKVIRKPVIMLWTNVPFLGEVGRMILVGSLR